MADIRQGSIPALFLGFLGCIFCLVPITSSCVFALNLARGVSTSALASFKRGLRYPVVFFEALFGIAWWVGLSGLTLFILAPMAIARTSQVFYLIIDGDIINPWQISALSNTFTNSFRLTKGNAIRLFSLQLLTLAGVILGFYSYGIALLFVVPFFCVLWAAVFVRISDLPATVPVPARE
jgi:hypothetical protein